MGLIIVTVVKHLYRTDQASNPHPAWSCSRGAAAVSQLLTCKAGMEEGATPKWCHPVFEVWGVALTTLHPPLLP